MVNSVGSIRAACEGPTSTPLQQHSLVGDRGRANHPPVVPVQQGSRTQGFYGRKPWKKPNSTLIINGPRPAEEGLRRPFRKLPPNRSLKLPANPPHSRPGYRHNSPKAQPAPEAPAFLPRSPRVEERGPSPVGLPVAVEPPQRPLLGRKRHAVVFEQRQLHHPQALLLRQPRKPLPVVGVRVLQSPPLNDERPRIAEHLLVVLGGLQSHEVGVLPPHPRASTEASFQRPAHHSPTGRDRRRHDRPRSPGLR